MSPDPFIDGPGAPPLVFRGDDGGTVSTSLFPSPTRLTFLLPHGHIDVPLGDGAAVPTAGGQVINEIARPERVPLTDYVGDELIRVDVPVMFDGWPKRSRHSGGGGRDLPHGGDFDARGDRRWEPRSVEKPLWRLAALWRGKDGQPPTPFRARGPIPYSGHRFTMEFPDWGQTIRRKRDGQIIRQELTLHLVEFVSPNAVDLHQVSTSTWVSVRNPVVTLKKPLTCIEIAGRYLGDPSRGKEVAKLNKIRDPRKKVAAGTRIKLPLAAPSVGSSQPV